MRAASVLLFMSSSPTERIMLTHKKNSFPKELPMPRLIVFAAALLVSFSSLISSAVAQDAKPTRFTVLMMEKPAGVQTTTTAADGSRNLSFEFNDRGRGPKLTATVRLDASSVPTSIKMEGVDYIKSPVTET